MMILLKLSNLFLHFLGLFWYVRKTIDADYRGEVGVILMNHGKTAFHIQRGDRIAQMIIAPFVQADFQTVSELSETERGTGGFGSSGKQ